jgi:hypothetical protein
MSVRQPLRATIYPKQVQAGCLDCVWYEQDPEKGECLNRHDFICHKHREDVFGRNKPEKEDD